MEQPEVQVEEGINLLEIFKLFLRKLKFIVIAVLIGGILGASFAVWKTIDINHYGTSVEFYVNPEKERDSTATDTSQYGVYGAYGKHVMDNMIKLLGSESFAEQMILNGEKLPALDVWVNEQSEEEKKLNLNSKILVAKKSLANLETEQKTMTTLIEALATEAERMTVLQEELASLWADLYSDQIVVNATFYEPEYTAKIKNMPETDPDYEKVQAVKQTYENYDDSRSNVTSYTESIDAQQKIIEPIQEKTDELINVALESWRKTAKYKSTLSRYNSAVTFSYLQGSDSSTDANDLARSFIYVDIFVLNDYEFANEVLERVKTVVPAYVETNMTVPSGYVGTNCQRITRTDDIRMTNPGYTTNQAIKYGVIAAFVAFVIACAVIVILDKADKRLRDTSIITKQFNVPLLGLIPSIEELKEIVAEEPSEKEAK